MGTLTGGPDGFAGDHYVNRVSVQLRKMAQSHQTTSVDSHFELKVINFTIGGDSFLGNNLAVSNKFHKSISALYKPAVSRSVKIDSVSSGARARRSVELPLRNGHRRFRCKRHLDLHFDFAGLCQAHIGLTGRLGVNSEFQCVSIPVAHI